VKSTKDIAYTERLENENTWWKRLLDVQRPYRANLHKLDLGYVLDIGCGIGRNLKNLQILGVRALGIDHNEHSVKEAIHRGFDALDASEFEAQYNNKRDIFDSFLFSHVLEHMTSSQAASLIHDYLPLLKPNGKIVMITPQERGFASDPTHVEFMDFLALNKILEKCGLKSELAYSFPFPRFVGRIFKYNEFVVSGRNPGE